MQIRLLPISIVFTRFTRLVRDLAASTGKDINLMISGETTEIDKTVIEVIGDHMMEGAWIGKKYCPRPSGRK